MTETFNKSPVDSPEEEEVHCTADIEQRKLLKKKQLVIPRVFLYEASFICLHQFEEIRYEKYIEIKFPLAGTMGRTLGKCDYMRNTFRIAEPGKKFKLLVGNM